jgi:hypothetical protein
MQTVNKLFKTLILLSALLGSSSLSAQDMTLLEERAQAAIASLKQGTLVVRLPSQRTKLEAMQAVMDDPNTSEAARRRLQTQKEFTIADTREFNLNARSAFQDNYDFSALLFIFDHSTDELQDGRSSGIFLDSTLEVDEAIQLRDPPFFFLRFGSTSSGVEAMVITDEHFRDLSKPFPFYQRLNDFSSFMNSIFFLFSPNRKEEDIQRVVDKLNKKLYKYHEMVRPGGGS